MKEENTSEKKIAFIQYDQPQLEDGNYSITIEQSISDTGTNAVIPATTYINEKRFFVRGERYSLNPDDVVSVFPPPFNLGEFSNVLPHVILKSTTFPWERSLGLEIKINDAPWLGLLIFNEGTQDKTPVASQGTVLDLLKSTDQTETGLYGKLPDTTFFPDFPTKKDTKFKVLDYGESWSDSCSIIDISTDFFNKIAPTANDLAWLANVKETEIVNKSETYIKKYATNSSDSGITTSKFAQIVGNRFPAAGKKCTVHLVSFENFRNYLPGDKGENNIPKDFVRLVSLKSWTFTSIFKKFTFSGLLLEVNNPESSDFTNAFRMPYPKDIGTDGEKALSNAIKMGYTAFNHRMRTGDKTVSWYRGPFIPFDGSNTVNVPINTSDAATIYNPDTGMFDVSYSSAWQIGKLLALQNVSFATALYNWKRENIKQTIRSIESSFTDLSLSKIAELMNESLLNYVDPLAKNENSEGNENKTLRVKYNSEKKLGAINNVFNNHALLAKTLKDSNKPIIPYEIANWLARLKLLYGVPVNYLIPDERMLPNESIRFFYLDEGWLNSLLAGAFSIGDSTSGEAAHTAVFTTHMQNHAKLHTPLIRNAIVGRPVTMQSTNDMPEKATGFLLRSEVVKGWPGLEVHGQDSSGTKLNLLRFTNLGPDIILCLFDGVVKTVEIQEHSEALHFGVDYDKQDTSPKSFKKKLRYLTQKDENDPGSQIPESKISPIQIAKFMNDPDYGVLKINELAGEINELLQPNFYTRDITSAEFALEMVEGVEKVTFKF